MSNLIPFRAGLDYPKGEESDKIIDQNFATLAKQSDKTGLYLKGSAISSTAQTISSTSFVDLDKLKVSVNLSGGLVLVYAIVQVKTNQSLGTLQLLNKETEIDTTASGSAGTDAYSMQSMFWAGNLPAGQTVFKIRGKTNNIAMTISEVAKSKIYVFEYTKG